MKIKMIEIECNGEELRANRTFCDAVVEAMTRMCDSIGMSGNVDVSENTDNHEGSDDSEESHI